MSELNDTPAGSPDPGDHGPEPHGHLTPDLLDWKWIFEQREKMAFEPYRGLHIAVHERKVIGAAPPGPDSLTFLGRVAEFYSLDPRRIVVAYIDAPGDFF